MEQSFVRSSFITRLLRKLSYFSKKNIVKLNIIELKTIRDEIFTVN